nr:hypothetical protein [uncultured Flavobacterium sp.]
MKDLFFDLYGFENAILILKQQKYLFVSWCNNSIPTAGSRTTKIEKLNSNTKAEIFKTINHKNGDITLKTNLGYLKFSK